MIIHYFGFLRFFKFEYFIFCYVAFGLKLPQNLFSVVVD